MNLFEKMLYLWHYVFGAFVGVSLFYFGKFRISSGVASVRLSDPYVAHYMSTGLLYMNLGLIMLVIVAVIITYSLTKSKR